MPWSQSAFASTEAREEAEVLADHAHSGVGEEHPMELLFLTLSANDKSVPDGQLREAVAAKDLDVFPHAGTDGATAEADLRETLGLPRVGPGETGGESTDTKRYALLRAAYDKIGPGQVPDAVVENGWAGFTEWLKQTDNGTKESEAHPFFSMTRRIRERHADGSIPYESSTAVFTDAILDKVHAWHAQCFKAHHADMDTTAKYTVINGMILILMAGNPELVKVIGVEPSDTPTIFGSKSKSRGIRQFWKELQGMQADIPEAFAAAAGFDLEDGTEDTGKTTASPDKSSLETMMAGFTASLVTTQKQADERAQQNVSRASPPHTICLSHTDPTA